MEVRDAVSSISIWCWACVAAEAFSSSIPACSEEMRFRSWWVVGRIRGEEDFNILCEDVESFLVWGSGMGVLCVS